MLVFADVEFLVPVAVIVMLMSVFIVMGVIALMRVSVLMGGRGQGKGRDRPSAEEEVGKIPRRGGEHELDREDDADGEELALPGQFCKGEDEQGFVVGRNKHGKERAEGDEAALEELARHHRKAAQGDEARRSPDEGRRSSRERARRRPHPRAVLQKFDEHIEHEQEGQHFERIEKGIQNDVEQSAGLREFLGEHDRPRNEGKYIAFAAVCQFFRARCGKLTAKRRREKNVPGR